MRKRSRLDAYHDVLAAIRSGVQSPSRIALCVNLSWPRQRRIIDELFEQGFIEVVERINTKRYHINVKCMSAPSYCQAAQRSTVSRLAFDT